MEPIKLILEHLGGSDFLKIFLAIIFPQRENLTGGGCAATVYHYLSRIQPMLIVYKTSYRRRTHT